MNKSFALQIGVDYIIDQEIEILAEGATHSFDVSGEGSKFAKIYGGLAIKF